jgi:hypothetical protein
MPIRRRNVSPLAPVPVLALALALALAAALTFSGPAARAQVPEPANADTVKRSGLVGRWIPVTPNLPPDPRRDQWYDTRWGDPPNMTQNHPNYYRNGGLYGIAWKANHTASIYPYFYGSPGRSTINSDVRHVGYLERLPRMLFHPFKPIGMYYDQGSYVPVYDLDPIVPGPTGWPYPFYRRITSAGG